MDILCARNGARCAKALILIAMPRAAKGDWRLRRETAVEHRSDDVTGMRQRSQISQRQRKNDKKTTTLELTDGSLDFTFLLPSFYMIRLFLSAVLLSSTTGSCNAISVSPLQHVMFPARPTSPSPSYQSFSSPRGGFPDYRESFERPAVAVNIPIALSAFGHPRWVRDSRRQLIAHRRAMARPVRTPRFPC